MKILALSPHTDDVELGCGGTISRLLEEGHSLRWVVFSCATESVPEGMPGDTILNEFKQNVRLLALDAAAVEIMDLPVRRFDEHRQDVLEKLVVIRNSEQPDLVISPSPHDVHQDHEVVYYEAIRAFKSACSIICYELPWNQLRNSSQMFMRLEKRHLDQKMAMLRNYRSQYAKGRNYFSEEFVYGLAAARGVQCNAPLAEAFDVIRWMM